MHIIFNAGLKQAVAEMTSSAEANFVSDGSKPLVTIVIPVYNGADFLTQSIQSALNQTYEAIEIIVINDGSTDGGATERVARSFGESIRYFSKTNGGVASALNLAIREMSGDYFSWLSHDDLYSDDKVARQVEYLSAHGANNTIVYSDYSIFTNDGVTEAIAVCMPGVDPELFRYWITSESALHGCSLLIPRSAFSSIGGFNEGLRTTQDYELWFRMAGTYRFVHLPLVLVSSRSHSNQDTHKIADIAFAEAGALYLEFVQELEASDMPVDTERTIGTAYRQLASSLWQRGFADAADHSAALARQHGASSLRLYSAQLLACAARISRRCARTFFSPQARQVIRRFFTRMSACNRGR